ncbi:hypothetical protein Tco_0720039 [Tanacetum coccineum]
MAGLLCNKFKGGKDKAMLVKDTLLDNALNLKGLGMLHGLRKKQCWLKHMNPTEDLDAYDSDSDDVSNAKAVQLWFQQFLRGYLILTSIYFYGYQKCATPMKGLKHTSVVDFTNK